MPITLLAALTLAPPDAAANSPPLLPTTLDPKSALPIWPATLERVSQGPAGAVYIDPSSVVRSGNMATVRVASIPPQESDATSYMWSLEQIDCTAKTVGKTLYVRYTEDGRVLGANSSPAVAIPPGAQALDRIARICEGGIDRSRTGSFPTMMALLHTAWPIVDAEIAKLPSRKTPTRGD